MTDSGITNSIAVWESNRRLKIRMESCCGSEPGVRFYCKPVTLVRCREIEGENRFYVRVGGTWLCEINFTCVIN
jgi:hypothetical protein